jgi:hypothetical protein
MNAVEIRIWELGSFELGAKKTFVRAVRRREIVGGKRYAWLLFVNEKDPEPVDTVVLDVSPEEAWAIDLQVGAERIS